MLRAPASTKLANFNISFIFKHVRITLRANIMLNQTNVSQDLANELNLGSYDDAWLTHTEHNGINYLTILMCFK